MKALSFAALALLVASPASAQVGHEPEASPYRDLEGCQPGPRRKKDRGARVGASRCEERGAPIGRNVMDTGRTVEHLELPVPRDPRRQPGVGAMLGKPEV